MRNSFWKLYLFIFLFQLYPLLISGQVKEIGAPFIVNYPRKITKAGQQNWMIDQDRNGIMYFANNEGLLEFNGFDWFINPIPNRSVIRSLKVIEDQIFVGGFNELGYFERNSFGKLDYHSLIALIPENFRDFGDIWKIHLIGDNIIFQSFRYIFYFNHGKFTRVIQPPGLFHFSYALAGELYVNDIHEGLFRVAPEKLVQIPGLEALRGKEIWGMLQLNESILIATADDGLFNYSDFKLHPWNNLASKYLKQNQIYSLVQLSDGNLAFGTVQNGLLICTPEGAIIKIINRKRGLQNNTVLSLFQDTDKNLWMGLDNGIDYLQINSPFSYFNHSEGLSAGYASANFGGRLYLGTNQGVFFEDWNKLTNEKEYTDFSLIESTRGQVWNLMVIDSTLFCGHNRGFFQIDKDKASLICDQAGGWMLSRPPSHPDLMIGGTYTGFVLFRKQQGKWKYIQAVEGLEESARFFQWENDSILWMSHGLKGIYRLRFNADYIKINDVKLFGAESGLPSDFNLEVNKWENEILVTSPKGIYEYNEKDNYFYLNQKKTDLFEGQFPLKLIVDNKKNIWYFTDQNMGVLRKQEDGSLNLITIPFTTISNNYIRSFQHLNVFDSKNVIFGSDNGFIHYDPSFSKNYDYNFHAYISQIGFVKSDSVLSNINIVQLNNSDKPFKNKENHFVFNFGAGDYENLDNLLFSTYLEGYENDWDIWSSKRTREYTNLKDGNYLFRVRAKNGFKTISQEASYVFTILPPWYKTWWAYLIYLLLFVVALFSIFLYVRLQIKILKRKEKVEQLRIRRQNENVIKREKLQAEKELFHLKNEQLRVEMVGKDKELANSTLQMIQKNKLLNRLKQELDKMNAKISDDLVRNQNHALIRRINKEIEDKNQWNVFEEHFEAVHEAFLKRLKKEYPDLSPRELKLAAYLRLNISTKEIALLMNISTRGVEIARYRLRKKFNLLREQNLLDFILNF